MRARNRLRVAGASLPFAYNFWIRNIERPQQLDERAAEAAQSWLSKPTFAVVIDARSCTSSELTGSIRSVEQQVYADWTISVIGGEPNYAASLSLRLKKATSLMSAVNQCTAGFFVPLIGGDQLSRGALFYFAEALRSQSTAVILYGDEDEFDERGARRRPWFKPCWNKELFLARDYLSRACAIRAAAVGVAAAGVQFSTSAWAFDLLLRVITAHEVPIVHVPRIVAHVVDVDSQPDQNARIEAITRYVGALGASASAGPFQSVKVSWPLPDPLPLVSIIIPTRDKLELLRPCVESILEHTKYDRMELVIIDNGSVEPQTCSYLESLRENAKVRVLPYPQRYNYSAINNYAAREALGSFLCLLNNDTVVVESSWLDEMMRYAVRPEIGAVGAKLLYADRSIQHAGVIVGMGDAAGHAHRNLPAEDPGYFGHAHLPQFVSAVTGACLVVDKRKFLEVGGLDEELLPIAYNDVDLCMKLQQRGWRNVYVPHAILIHHESKSRAKDHTPSRIESYKRELQTFQDRWDVKDYKDPLLNPNLDRSSETFVIRF